jgi:hypothetical protein
MTTSRKTQSALRAALKNEDAALAQRLPDTVKPAKPAAAKPAATKPAAAKPAAAKPVAAKPVAAKPVAAKPVAAKPAAVTPPAVPAVAALLQMRPVSTAKPEKCLCETFSLGRSDIDRLAALKARGEKSGSKYGRSEMLRAGLLLLEELDTGKVSALIEGLPAFKKGKPKKK